MDEKIKATVNWESITLNAEHEVGFFDSYEWGNLTKEHNVRFREASAYAMMCLDVNSS